MKKIYYSIVLVMFGLGTLSAQDAGNVPAETKKADEKKLEITGRIQARIVMGDQNSGYAKSTGYDAVDFNFRRLRLGAKYTPVSWFGTVLDIKAENMINSDLLKGKGGTASAYTAPLGLIQEANLWFKPGFLGTVIKVGQFKIPFLREQLTSSGNLMTVEHSYSEALLEQNDIGILIEMQPLAAIDGWADKLDLAFSVTNGDGSGTDGSGAKKGEVSNKSSFDKLYNWRVQVNPFGGPTHDGKPGSWKEGAEIFQGDQLLWSIAAGGAHTSGNEVGLFKGGAKFNAYSFDTTFFWNGIYVNGEYTLASGDAVPSTGYSSWQATAGYNLPLGSIYLMPVVRYSTQAYDSNKNGKIDTTEQLSTLWVGANLFALKHDLKFQVFYSIVNDAAKSQLKENTLIFEVQTNFGKKI